MSGLGFKRYGMYVDIGAAGIYKNDASELTRIYIYTRGFILV